MERFLLIAALGLLLVASARAEMIESEDTNEFSRALLASKNYVCANIKGSMYEGKPEKEYTWSRKEVDNSVPKALKKCCSECSKHYGDGVAKYAFYIYRDAIKCECHGIDAVFRKCKGYASKPCNFISGTGEDRYQTGQISP